MNTNTLRQFDGVVRTVSIAGNETGPLVGLKFAAKDNFDIEGFVTGAGNPDWERTHDPAKETATAVSLLLESGASLNGKSCTDELAFSLDGMNMHYGVPINHQYPDRIPGGSSSGSASLVSAGAVDFALGTDTSGSVRVPASNCGIYGIRPTHGRISTKGVVPLAPSYDTVGWFARSAEMLARCGTVLLNEQLPDVELKEIRVVMLQSTFDALERQLRQEVESFYAHIADLFAETIVERQITYDRLSGWATSYRYLQGFEAWKAHREWIESCQPKFHELIAQRFKFASSVTQEQYDANLPLRKEVGDLLKAILDERTLLCLPPTWNIPPLTSAQTEELLQYREKNFTRACMASIAATPQIAIPVPLQSGKRFGLSFMALPGNDTLLLKVAALLEHHSNLSNTLS